MKSIYSGALALTMTLSIGSAIAADLPSRKAPPYIPPPPPPPLWTGFYVGLNAGGTWAANDSVVTTSYPAFIGPPGAGITVAGNTARALAAAAAATTNLGSNNNGGFIGGGQIGYNFQFANSFVAGIEADIQGIASGGGSTSALTNAPVDTTVTTVAQYPTVTTVSRRLDYLGTVRGRIGWLLTPTLLVYGTGGLAYGGVSSSASVSQVAASAAGVGFAALPLYTGGGSFSDTRVGWTAGGGLEWMFLPNWSAKVEYLYYDLGTTASSFLLAQPTTVAGVPFSFVNVAESRARFDGHVVRAGVNYHFNWGAPSPVVAKY